MLKKKMISVRKLTKRAKPINLVDEQGSTQEALLGESYDPHSPSDRLSSPGKRTPSGSFAIYIGEGRERFVLPTNFLSHPLFKMLLEKASDEFGFDHKSGLVVPCSVATFERVVDAVQECHGRFDVRKLLEELV